MALLLDKDRLEAALQKMSDSVVTTIEPLGVNTVEKVHSTRQARVRRLDQEVVIVGHQAICMTDPAVSVDNVGKDFEESGSITVVKKDVLLRIATTGNVVDSAFVLQPQRSGHSLYRLAQRIQKNEGLNPHTLVTVRATAPAEGRADGTLQR